MRRTQFNWDARTTVTVLFVFVASALPELALAQASPFDTGATALVASVTTIATPIAVLLVMGLGIAAAAGQLSWGWPIGVIVGIGLVFAANPMVTWVRGLFGA